MNANFKGLNKQLMIQEMQNAVTAIKKVLHFIVMKKIVKVWQDIFAVQWTMDGTLIGKNIGVTAPNVLKKEKPKLTFQVHQKREP